MVWNVGNGSSGKTSRFGGNNIAYHSNTTSTPLFKWSDHVAAVKAVAWSPHQHGLLASGGGTADKHIRFRNTLTG